LLPGLVNGFTGQPQFRLLLLLPRLKILPHLDALALRFRCTTSCFLSCRNGGFHGIGNTGDGFPDQRNKYRLAMADLYRQAGTPSAPQLQRPAVNSLILQNKVLQD
jgi:hypothetical protein